jgi:hypothetical protein
MPQVGFEPTIPVFERTKTVHVLDRTATSTGTTLPYYLQPIGYVQYVSGVAFTLCELIAYDSPRLKNYLFWH